MNRIKQSPKPWTDEESAILTVLLSHEWTTAKLDPGVVRLIKARGLGSVYQRFLVMQKKLGQPVANGTHAPAATHEDAPAPRPRGREATFTPEQEATIRVHAGKTLRQVGHLPEIQAMVAERGAKSISNKLTNLRREWKEARRAQRAEAPKPQRAPQNTLNFCPNCGCNMLAVRAALDL